MSVTTHLKQLSTVTLGCNPSAVETEVGDSLYLAGPPGCLNLLASSLGRLLQPARPALTAAPRVTQRILFRVGLEKCPIYKKTHIHDLRAMLFYCSSAIILFILSSLLFQFSSSKSLVLLLSIPSCFNYPPLIYTFNNKLF